MCDHKKYYLEKIRPKHNLNRGNKRPPWFREFIETTTDNKTEPLNCGSYKIVYPFGEYTVAIEEGDKTETPRSISIIKTIPERYQKHFIYPVDIFFTKGYTVSKLSLCPSGDLRDLLDGKYFYKLEPQMFTDLAKALDQLHQKNVAVSDLKPENIMLCKCGCLAFIDLDSSITLENGVPKKFTGTPYYNPFLLIKDKKPRDFFISDWAAMAIIVLQYIAAFVGNMKGEWKLYDLMLESDNDRDFFYKQLRYRKVENHVYYEELGLDPLLVRSAMTLLHRLFKREPYMNRYGRIPVDRYVKEFSDEVEQYIDDFRSKMGLDEMSLQIKRYRTWNTLKF